MKRKATTTTPKAPTPVARKAALVKRPKSIRERKLTKARSEAASRKEARVEKKIEREAELQARRAEAERKRLKALAKVERDRKRREDRLKASLGSGATASLTRLKHADRLRSVAKRLRPDAARAALPKPPYRVPSMAEVHATPGNGLRVVSTFSGCGGACLGLRMAGFEAAYAVEFIPIAAESYRANHPGVLVDTRDVRLVKAEEILERIGLGPGELDVLEGSPPCASFSMSGKREGLWGKVKDYSETRQRVDDLFFEFVRLIRGLKPRVVLAENVPGLAMTTATGILNQVLDAIRAEGYRVEHRIVSAAEQGVPQKRRRLIIQAVRLDLDRAPAWPEPLPYRYLVREAWEGVPVGEKEWCGRYKVGKLWEELIPGEEHEVRFNLKRLHPDQVSFTITQNMGNDKGACKHPAQVMHPSECRYLTIPEAKRICSFPDDFKLVGTFSQQYERLGRAVPPLMYKRVGEAIRDRVLDT